MLRRLVSTSSARRSILRRSLVREASVSKYPWTTLTSELLSMSTSHTVCTRLRKLSSEKKVLEVNSWDSAIRRARLRIQELKLALEAFQEKKRAGEPWPG